MCVRKTNKKSIKNETSMTAGENLCKFKRINHINYMRIDDIRKKGNDPENKV
jgi:hypothetical protein